MINEIKTDAQTRMQKSVESLQNAFSKIRTGRAHPSILDSVMVPYYGSDTPLRQLANVVAEDARTLALTVFDTTIRIPMPALTEETRKGYTRQARQEAEGARVAVRNVRRDALNDIKELVKEKEISEDDERRAADEIQKITDKFVEDIDSLLAAKETDLMEV